VGCILLGGWIVWRSSISLLIHPMDSVSLADHLIFCT
jgi:hypothetical protein